MSGLYLEPIAFLYGAPARDAVTMGAALPLGRDGVAFAGARLWEGEPGAVKHATVRITTLLALRDAGVRDLLDKITSPRSPIAGISMAAPAVMGIVNVTPDSFSDGADLDTTAVIAKAKALFAEGADVLDIGGESTRPGAQGVALQEELRRVIPVVEGLADVGAPLSIDTRKGAVMQAAARAGAQILNDVSALTHDPRALQDAASLDRPVILVHARGQPDTMQQAATYQDVVVEVYNELEQRIAACLAGGIPRARLLIDPGLGFAKKASHSLALLRHLSIFHGLGVPIVVGASRKGFLGAITGTVSPRERAPESIAASLTAASQGAHILRAHDVRATKRSLEVWRAVHELSHPKSLD